MSNKKLIIGIAAGAAALAAVGILISRNRSRRMEFEAQAEEAKANFKSKLNELQRKAKKEYKNSAEETRDTINSAKERANDWVNKSANA